MIIGVPKEIKNHEYRVGITPMGARELTEAGHTVYVETNAGTAIGMDDSDYIAAGAHILPSAEDVFAKAEMIVKVKEPQPQECKMLRADQTLFTYLHLAPDPQQAALLIESGATCIAYETVTDARGALPLLAPMSEVAGRLSLQAAARCLEKAQGGNGVLLGGVPGVAPANVVVIGGGVVGLHAARMAIGLGANTTIVDRSIDRLRTINEIFQGRIGTLYSNKANLEDVLSKADVVIGAALVPGGAAPKIITRDMLSIMQKGTVLVDVAIDQGGCFETSKATTHQDPTYVVDGIIHYCVANMPGAVAKTSTLALTNATLPFVMALANKGPVKALLDDANLLNGLNVIDGKYTCKPVAEALNAEYFEPRSLLAAKA